MGRPLSVRGWLSPCVSAEAVALHEEPPSVHDRLPPSQLRLDAHETFAPPSLPEQVHEYGPEPLTLDEAPTAQRNAELGADVLLPPFAEPHSALTAVTQLPPDPPHEPWLQLKVRSPVVGKTLSLRARLAPCCPADMPASQAEAPIVHDCGPLSQLWFELQESVEPP